MSAGEDSMFLFLFSFAFFCLFISFHSIRTVTTRTGKKISDKMKKKLNSDAEVDRLSALPPVHIRRLQGRSLHFRHGEKRKEKSSFATGLGSASWHSALTCAGAKGDMLPVLRIILGRNWEEETRLSSSRVGRRNEGRGSCLRHRLQGVDVEGPSKS